MQHTETLSGYLCSCKSEFWQKVFLAEIDYLQHHLAGCKDVMSVGCGPAIIESALSEHGFCVTGVDISVEALACASDHVKTITASAEDMDFPDGSFDAAIYVASLQFIEDYRKAIEKTAYILRPGGRLIVMLLNLKSVFFKERLAARHSYVQQIKHTDLNEVEEAIARHFNVQAEYFLAVKDDEVICESGNIIDSLLYIVTGQKKNHEA